MRQPARQPGAVTSNAPSMGRLRDQARKEALSRLLESSRPGDLLVLAGGDLVSLGKLALGRKQECGFPEVVLYAPGDEDHTNLNAAFDGGLQDMALTPDRLAEILAGHLVYEPASRISLFPSKEQADFKHIPQLRQARAAMDSALDRSRVNAQTRQVHWRNWLDNLVHNFPGAFRLPDITNFSGVFRGIPALVLGAGPSLDQSLPLLPEAAGKCLVLGAASVLAPLDSVGVKPHLVAALEGKDESRQFQGVDTERTLLAAASSGHFNHFLKWPGRASVFHMQPWVSALSGQGLVLPTGGHATSAAFSLAVLWGADPIILAGQDLAYPGGRIHASGRPGGEDYRLPDMSEVPAIGGGSVPTSAVMKSYLNWYQESASYMKSAHPERRLLNATSQGAFIAGFEHGDLGQILGQLPKLSGGINLVSLAGRLPVAGGDALARGIAKEIALARRLVAALDSGEPGQALSQAGPNSATGWLFESMGQGAPSGEILSGAKYLLESLTAMREGLHGAS